MAAAFGVSRFIMDSGERSCLVVDHSTCLPLYYPNLYLTTQLRNRSIAASTIETEATHLVVLLRFLDQRGIDLEGRLSAKQFFKDFEIDALSDFSQHKLRRLPAKDPNNSVVALSALEGSVETVENSTHYDRLTAIANYLGWFARHHLDGAEPHVAEQIETMCDQIKARRPLKKGRNDHRLDRSLSDEQLDVLFEVIRPGSEFNPFSESLQRRNRLVILLLFHLGIRRGELLNIRNRDIDFSRNQLKIVRRADEKDDARVDEPNAKTLGRVLSLRDTLVKELHEYITQDRRKVRNTGPQDFLFVTHKEGPTEGQPMSKAAYHKVVNAVRTVSPSLQGMSGHMLRHTWNRRFSEKMDSLDTPLSEARQEQIRSFLMGWKEGSGTSAIYNRRFAEQKAHEASLELQKSSGTRVPRNLNGDL